VVTAVPRRVTLVADQALGYHRTGGLGTATTFLALALGRIGYDVEILYLGDIPSGPVEAEWADLYERMRVRIRPLEPVDTPVEPPYFARMRAVELALRANPPNVVIVQDLGAPGYSALQLRRLGLAFQNTLFVVYCHGSRQWITNMARKVRVLPGALAVSRLEQATVELADVVVSPSAYMVDWMRAQGWRLPEKTLVIPLVTRGGATGESPTPAQRGSNGKVERIAFFGRFEERKGVRPFVAGLNSVAPELLEGVELEFLGRSTEGFEPERIEALLSEGAKRALRGVSFETELDQHDVLARLSRPGTVAVMPSLEDNSPAVVYECLERRIPFIASALGGASELVSPEERTRVLFEPTREGVAAALRRALAGGDALRPVRPAFEPAQPVQQWADVVASPPEAEKRFEQRPAVEAIVVNDGVPESNARCLAALESQTYERLRASPVVVEAGGSVETARATGGRSASARWILFLDEKDAPEPELVETLVHAQASSCADVVSCGLYLDTDGAGRTERFFLGEPGGLGLLENHYGTAALLRRSLLEESSNPLRSGGDPDWRMLARLSTAGAQIVSVPLPLVTSRSRPGTLERNPTDGLLVVEHFERSLPEQLRSLARLAAGLAADTWASPSGSSAGFIRRVARALLRRSR
jgi:glycosyltransferase involved in cell wall biosynthesis